MVSMTTALRCHVVTIGRRLGQLASPAVSGQKLSTWPGRPAWPCVPAGLAGSGAGWLVPVCLAPLPADGPV
jgi:hypothetical protein